MRTSVSPRYGISPAKKPDSDTVTRTGRPRESKRRGVLVSLSVLLVGRHLQSSRCSVTRALRPTALPWAETVARAPPPLGLSASVSRGVRPLGSGVAVRVASVSASPVGSLGRRAQLAGA